MYRNQSDDRLSVYLMEALFDHFNNEFAELLILTGGTLLNPLKIKPPIADFLYPPRGFKGVKSPKNLAPLLTF